MQYLSIKDQLLIERKKNAALTAEVAKNKADTDYIAMMCDVELEMPEDEMMDTEVEEG
ncbi:MAG: hypothetical protein IJ391_03400 [Clostridia bacterium]|nr:hypothetical protein [Clostridia bacterium]